MWSIGVIATALLTGDVIFTNRINPNYKADPATVILDMAAECDLSVLDNLYSAWAVVGDRPKDFVRKLLVLDEEQRSTIHQALAHEWFTNKHLADQFDAVYQRAITGWEPRRKIFRLIEALDHSRLPPQGNSPSSGKDEAGSSTSRYFVRPSIPDLPASALSNSNTLNKRVYTPLPKIAEEPELDELSMTDSEIHDPDVESVFDVQNSLSLLDISAISSTSDLGTDFVTSDDVALHKNHLGVPLNQFTDSNVSSCLDGPPPSPSSTDVSDVDVIPDTPPPNRKRKSSPPSETLDDPISRESSLDDMDRVSIPKVVSKRKKTVSSF
jgi:serine/threonine protein kinase